MFKLKAMNIIEQINAHFEEAARVQAAKNAKDREEFRNWIAIVEGYALCQERNLALVEEFLAHIPVENDYLRKQGAKLLDDIRSGLTKEGDPVAGEPRVVCLEAHPDEQERSARPPSAQGGGDPLHRGQEARAEGPTASGAPTPPAP